MIQECILGYDNVLLGFVNRVLDSTCLRFFILPQVQTSPTTAINHRRHGGSRGRW